MSERDIRDKLFDLLFDLGITEKESLVRRLYRMIATMDTLEKTIKVERRYND